MNIALIVLGCIIGGYMLLDGLHVMIKGKYIGTELGLWANLFRKFNIDVLKLGTLFVIFGVMWLFWVYSLWSGQDWATILGLVLSVLTLWYAPIGTLLSVAVFALLLVS